MTDLLQLLNVLIIPALVYVVRIDRRMGQLDTLSGINAGRIERLETDYKDVSQRLMRIEFRP